MYNLKEMGNTNNRNKVRQKFDDINRQKTDRKSYISDSNQKILFTQRHRKIYSLSFHVLTSLQPHATFFNHPLMFFIFCTLALFIEPHTTSDGIEKSSA